MTVEELIKQLQSENPKAKVYWADGAEVTSVTGFKEYDSDDGYNEAAVFLDEEE